MRLIGDRMRPWKSGEQRTPMDVLRKLSGYLAAAVALVVVIWIGRYSAYAPSAVLPTEPTLPTQNAPKATKPSSPVLAGKTQQSSRTEVKPPAIPEVVPPETLLTDGLQSARNVNPNSFCCKFRGPSLSSPRRFTISSMTTGDCSSRISSRCGLNTNTSYAPASSSRRSTS